VICKKKNTFLWKYELDLERIDASTITFEIVDEHRPPLSFPSTIKVKECGICPLYSKENDDDDDDGGGGGGDSINEEPSIKVKECGICPLYKQRK
jgi:hypothetical protein